jgi:uncharacterized membrane protein YdfJ with MMPL/SSD domain
VLGESFPQGALGPTSILVQRDGGQATEADLAEVRERLEGVDGVASIGEAQQGSAGVDASLPTFALPITFTFNIGFMVAVGILLDTFIVRTIMVPAAVELLGDRVWWPSTARGGGHALREHLEAEEHGVPEAARG